MTIIEVLAAVIDGLNASGAPYMVVGSFSSSVYGSPRMACSIDLV